MSRPHRTELFNYGNCFFSLESYLRKLFDSINCAKTQTIKQRESCYSLTSFVQFNARRCVDRKCCHEEVMWTCNSFPRDSMFFQICLRQLNFPRGHVKNLMIPSFDVYKKMLKTLSLVHLVEFEHGRIIST